MLKKFLSGIMILFFFAGCIRTTPSLPELVVSQTACTEGGASPSTKYQLPPNRIGGGETQNGAFHFQFWLYCDTANTPPEYTNEQSTIRGLGIFSSWDYQGESIAGPIDIAFGPAPANMPTLSFDGGLTPRSSGVFHKGIEISKDDLEQYIRSNQPVRYEIRIQTAQGGVFGATLSFVLKPAKDGYLPIDIDVQELKSRQ